MISLDYLQSERKSLLKIAEKGKTCI